MSRDSRLFAVLISLAALSASLWAQSPALNSELLVNGDFEAPLTTGWTVTSGSPALGNYGTSIYPTLAESSAMVGPPGAGGRSGGLSLLRVNASGSNVHRVEQVIDISGQAAAIDGNSLSVAIEAYLGGNGGSPDDAEVTVIFEDAAMPTAVLSTARLGPFSEWERRAGTRVIRRSIRADVPPGSRALRVQVTLTYIGGSFQDAFADNVSVKLINRPALPTYPIGQELLVNRDFELGTERGNDWEGWRHTSGTFTLQQYGVDRISFSYAREMRGPSGEGEDGGQFYARSTGNFNENIAEQRFDLRGVVADVDSGIFEVEYSGWLGTDRVETDLATISIAWYDGNESFISESNRAFASITSRNNQEVIVFRAARAIAPAGARSMRLVLGFRYGNGNFHSACADNISLKRVAPRVPSQVSYGTQLLVNPGFEVGTLRSNPWEGWVCESVFVNPRLYGSGAGSAPSLQMARDLSLGRFGAGHGGGNTTSTVSQVVDLSFLASDIDAGRVRFRSGFFQSIVNLDSDAVDLRLTFQAPIPSGAGRVIIGQQAISNIASVIGQRIDAGGFCTVNGSVPPFTREVVVAMDLVYRNGSFFSSWIDDAIFEVYRDSLPPLPYGTNLVHAGDFESGYALGASYPSHPAVRSWYHGGGFFANPFLYGGTTTPDSTSASSWNGGAYVKQSTGIENYFVIQDYELDGNLADVQAGTLMAAIEGWFGDRGTRETDCGVKLDFFDSFGAQLPQTVRTDRVRRADRNDQTVLVYRNASIAVPSDAVRMRLTLFLTSLNNQTEGMADNIALRLFNMGAAPAYPGSGGDLALETGIGGGLSGGPGFDVKDATVGDVLRVRVFGENLYGTGFPFLLAAQILPTGLVPNPFPFFPELRLDPLSPAFVFLADGLSAGPLNPAILRPGGNNFEFGTTGLPIGTSAFLQAIILDPLVATLFVMSDAHEIRFPQ